MTIRNDRRKFLPAALLSVVMAIASINIALAQPTQALSLGSILESLLGGGGASETTKPTVSPQQTPTTAPAPATTTTPAAQQSTAPAATTPANANSASKVATTAVTTPTQSANAASSVIADTAATVLATAAAQTHQVESSVVYPSAQIDAGKRDQLYAIAASVAIIGIALYGMTLIKMTKPSVAPVSRRPLLSK